MITRLLALTLPAAMLAGCGDATAPAALAGTGSNSACVADGQLAVTLYGDLHTTLNWRGDELTCEGMPRPQKQGARLRFAGPVAAGDDAHRLAFIVALPSLERGRTGKELAATVTLMQEDEGRFYSNRDNDICWSDIQRQQALAEVDSYAIAGIVYCVAPLAALNGEGSITLRDLRFTGRVNWRAPK